MAEARTMEEGLKAYQDGKFSRQSLFELVVARIKATEANLARLEEQYRVMVSAMVRGVHEAPAAVHPGYMTEEQAVGDHPLGTLSRSEKMKESWRKRKEAQSVADGVSSNG